MPDCPAVEGQRRVTRAGGAAEDHRGRRALAAASGLVQDRALASWLPLKPGLTPHGHKVWLDEERMLEILQHDRFGHSMSAIGGTYSHVSEAMRADLRAVLQERWETALGQRAALSPRSPVRLLDELLAPPRETCPEIVSRSPCRLPHVREPNTV
ncbi:hypothetical protein [Actinomadura violacea]|uniref:Uncharacterized protein n=1 Tax=Actinomadura violacea TaxID=2819934 RepID=A0ABS3RZE2_9ACTN|nr:hypothetical protein [Actinomadura violacea]MBO2462133.1 hypothetical protein [Actinomadura violacea]